MRTFALWMFLVGPVAAQEIVFVSGEARLCEQEVDAEVQHRMAVTRVRQVFENPGDRATEGTYSFLVPEEASLIGFTMWIGDRTMKGQIVDREEARRIYDAIVSKSRDPGIVEEIAPRVFRVRVFPIAPRSRMKFEVAYVSSLPSDGDGCAYVYPLRIDEARSKSLDRFSFQLRILTGGRLLDVASETHSVNVNRKSEREVLVAFDKRAGLDRDVVIRYSFGTAEPIFLAHRKSGEDGHFALSLESIPLKNLKVSKEIVYLIDRSSSVNPKILAAVKESLLRTFSNASQRDRVRVLPFNEGTLNYEGADPTALAKFLAPLAPHGRTDLEGALHVALLPVTDRPRVVVIVSDGRPSAGALAAPHLIARTLASLDRRTVLFGLRIGPESPERVFESLVTATGGECLDVGEDVAAAWDRLHRRISRPVVCDIEIDWGGAPVDRIHPAIPRLLFVGDQQMLVGRYRKSGRHIVTLRGGIGEQRVEISQAVVFPEAKERWGCTAYLWAGQEIRALLAETAQRNESSLFRKDIVSLSNLYQTVTPYTAFLVLENDEMYAEYGLERRVAEERRLFKRRSKKKLELFDGALDLPSVQPTLTPANPLKEASTGDHPLLKSLKWLASNRGWDLGSGIDLGRNGRLDAVGADALSLLALVGASEYELDPTNISVFERAASGGFARLRARQNPDTGFVGEDSTSDVLNHALATLAFVRFSAAKRDTGFLQAAQKALSFLCEQPAKAWKRASASVGGLVRLAFTEARAAGLELDESVLRFLPTREFGRENPSLQRDPLTAWIGTEVLRTGSPAERKSWRRSLEQVLREETKRARSDGSWLPAKWNEQALTAASALRILTEEAYDRGD